METGEVVGRRFKVAHVKTFARPGGESGRQFVEVSSCTKVKKKKKKKKKKKMMMTRMTTTAKSKTRRLRPELAKSDENIFTQKTRTARFHRQRHGVRVIEKFIARLRGRVRGFWRQYRPIDRKPHVAFREDPARILRAIRVSANETWNRPRRSARSTSAYAPLLSELNRERRMLETRAV